MFTDCRTNMANAPRCLGELDCYSNLTYAAIATIFNVYYHVPRHDLRILQRLCNRIHRSNADILVLKKLTPLVTRFAAQHFLDFLLSLLRCTIGQASKVLTAQGKLG